MLPAITAAASAAGTVLTSRAAQNILLYVLSIGAWEFLPRLLNGEVKTDELERMLAEAKRHRSKIATTTVAQREGSRQRTEQIKQRGQQSISGAMGYVQSSTPELRSLADQLDQDVGVSQGPKMSGLPNGLSEDDVLRGAMPRQPTALEIGLSALGVTPESYTDPQLLDAYTLPRVSQLMEDDYAA